jgi:hypothetical protein
MLKYVSCMIFGTAMARRLPHHMINCRIICYILSVTVSGERKTIIRCDLIRSISSTCNVKVLNDCFNKSDSKFFKDLE